MRLLWLFVILAIALLIPFLIWGEPLEKTWTREGLEAMGAWAGLVGVGLLIGDLLLPLPSTVIMSALGYLYGIWFGGALAALGSIGGGLTGYGLCRLLGQRAAVALAGARDLDRGRTLFEQHGAWLVALSRWLPILAEAIACLAGLSRMPFRRFLAALACGSVPLGFTFATIGHWGAEAPLTALGISALAPPLLWWLIGRRLTAPSQKQE